MTPSPTPVIICPGVHSATWTAELMAQLVQAEPSLAPRLRLFPVAPAMAWSGYSLRRWLMAELPRPERSPLTFLAFSAGCVAAAAIAHYWGHQGGTVQRVIAVDGWGVPLAGPFGVQRVSHDFLTHITTTGPAPTQPHFYADPAVSHQQIWRCPAQVQGWRVPPVSPQRGFADFDRIPMTALDFLLQGVISD